MSASRWLTSRAAAARPLATSSHPAATHSGSSGAVGGGDGGGRLLAALTHNIMDGRRLGALLDVYRRELPPLVHEHGLGIACIQVPEETCCVCLTGKPSSDALRG